MNRRLCGCAGCVGCAGVLFACLLGACGGTGSTGSPDAGHNRDAAGGGDAWRRDAAPPGPRTYYVAPTGSDSNPGTREQPLATPGAASAKLAAGDTLVIGPGTYVIGNGHGKQIVLPTSGTADAWITIRGEAGGALPVLEGAGGVIVVINAARRNYVRIENLEIRSHIDEPYSGGLLTGIDSGVESVVLRNLEVHHVEESAINFPQDMNHVTVENVRLHHTGGYAIGAPEVESGPGWQNVLFAGCSFEHAGFFFRGREARSEVERPDGFGIESYAGPIEVRDSISRYNFGDGIDSKAKNTYIHECLVENNYGDGLKLWGNGSRAINTVVAGTGYVVPAEVTYWSPLVIEVDEPDSQIEVTNCTFFDDSRRARRHYVMAVQYENRQIPINLILRNNIIAGLARAIISENTQLTAENNLFDNRDDSDGVQLEVMDGTTYTAATIGQLGVGNQAGDPLFVRGEWGPDGDFHLQPGSPAIDRGIAQGAPAIDLDHLTRPQGAGYDIGAYERRVP